MTRNLVLQSIEDDTGQRCVDIVRLADGGYCWRECRRDPEDAHGWRHLSHEFEVVATEKAARAAARAGVSWLT